jgi:hypothetical protein
MFRLCASLITAWLRVRFLPGAPLFQWACTNTADPVCTAISLATIERLAGVDPFPALDER